MRFLHAPVWVANPVPGVNYTPISYPPEKKFPGNLREALANFQRAPTPFLSQWRKRVPRSRIGS
ncbi:hypothetical protein OAE84_00285 [bacterium]|nr:hypothetical protein [bacterium]